MMATDIDKLVQSGEGETIEFKAQWTESVLETAAAFANTRGGTLLVGVDDEGRVVGLDLSERTLRTFSNRLADSLRIQPSLKTHTIDDPGGVQRQVLQACREHHTRNRAGSVGPLICRKVGRHVG